MPPKRRVVELSACVNGSNSCASAPRAMPMPVSRDLEAQLRRVLGGASASTRTDDLAARR